MKKRLALSFVAAVLIMACAAHEKAGDQAAALGDWKGAYAQYSAALAKDPESPELQAKYRTRDSRRSPTPTGRPRPVPPPATGPAR
jgi:hypothetical protein